MLSGIAIYGHGIILRIFGIFNTVTYSAVLFFSALMTLNRATVFFSPKVNELIFSRFRIFIPISVIWVYAILIGIILDLGGCYKMYSEKDLLLGFVCTEETVHPIIWAVRQGFLIFAMIEIEDIAFNFLLGPPNNIVQLWLNIICNWIMIAENLFNRKLIVFNDGFLE
ncbi:hypothetical protein Mgra_00009608 [Meloidogyne graminicola]|uniref:G_PROTEIN_RECEP_F1_2 domain-containing protein n=1 Tax=Meloidogyne graminicola TaxID=189291 RepID=A0A8S9ZC08_9BILA|nr:hypothetical protein Mgra_00009608 [Meloidogyne graminicola]